MLMRNTKKVHVLLKLPSGQVRVLRMFAKRNRTTLSEEIQRAVQHCMDLNRDCCLWVC